VITAVSTLLVLAAVGYVLTSRWRGRPVNPRRLLVPPAVLSGYGFLQLTGAAGRSLRTADLVLIAAGVAVSAGMGVGRGATVVVYAQRGRPWMRYRPATLAMWAATLAARVAVAAVSLAIGSATATRGPAILMSMGATLLAEGLVVTRRAFSEGNSRWQARSRRQSLATR
jgi:hypothetical protein